MAFLQQGQAMTKRQALEARERSGRSWLLTIGAFTGINAILMLLNSSFEFLFSAALPYHLLYFARFVTGTMPDVAYEGNAKPALPMWLLYAAIAITVVCVAIYVLLWAFSKRRPVVLLIGTVVFLLDGLTFPLLYPAVFTFSTGTILDIVLHVVALAFLIWGVVASFKLKKLPPEEEQPVQGAYAYPAEGGAPAGAGDLPDGQQEGERRGGEEGRVPEEEDGERAWREEERAWAQQDGRQEDEWRDERNEDGLREAADGYADAYGPYDEEREGDGEGRSESEEREYED